MDLTLRDPPLETVVDAAAAATFTAAAVFAISWLFGPAAAPVGLIAFAPAFMALRQVEADAEYFPLRDFHIPELRVTETGADELLLTSAMALEPASFDSNELVLEDILARIGPESRVVRLFDPAQIPTAGELKAGIDRHLHASRLTSNPPDATQALSDALAQLRRSLR